MTDGSGGRLVHVGSYTPDSGGAGRGKGISTYRRDPASGQLHPAGPVVPVSGPSFLAWHPGGIHLYAVNERTDGGVSAFTAGTDGGLTPLDSQPTGGADPCHLSVDPSGRYLVSANYTSGSVSVHPIRPDGGLAERTDLVQHHGSGPDPDRQAGPHAHQARFDPAGEHLLVTDLGTDEVYSYRLADGRLVDGPVVKLVPGTGPRHLAFTAGQVHVAGELDSTVTTFGYRNGTLTGPIGTVTSTGRRSGVRNYPSEIARSADDRFVYVANRGENTVAVFTTGPAGLTLAGEVSTGGDWPRHLALIGGHLYVANQNSDTVAVLGLDPATGLPGAEPEQLLAVPSPACVLG